MVHPERNALTFQGKLSIKSSVKHIAPQLRTDCGKSVDKSMEQLDPASVMMKLRKYQVEILCPNQIDQELYRLLVQNGHGFLWDIPGKGKRKLTWAYIKPYGKDCTNILYSNSTDNLCKNPTSLEIAHNLPDMAKIVYAHLVDRTQLSMKWERRADTE